MEKIRERTGQFEPSGRAFRRSLRAVSDAFTLVELIVVITILAILATVGFLSLSGFTDDARSATVAANVRTVYSAILTESTTSGNSPRYYVDHDPAAALSGGIVFVDGGAVTLTGGQWGSGGTNYSAGNPRWDRLKMNGEKFRLSAVLRGGFGGGNGADSGVFPGLADFAGAAYDTGAVSVGAFDYVGKAGLNGRARTVTYFQVAGISPSTKKASVTGNYTAVGTGSVAGLVRDPGSTSATGGIVESATVSNPNAGQNCASVTQSWYLFPTSPPGTIASVSKSISFGTGTLSASCSAGAWSYGTESVSCVSGYAAQGSSCVPTAPQLWAAPIVRNGSETGTHWAYFVYVDSPFSWSTNEGGYAAINAYCVSKGYRGINKGNFWNATYLNDVTDGYYSASGGSTCGPYAGASKTDAVRNETYQTVYHMCNGSVEKASHVFASSNVSTTGTVPRTVTPSAQVNVGDYVMCQSVVKTPW